MNQLKRQKIGFFGFWNEIIASANFLMLLSILEKHLRFYDNAVQAAVKIRKPGSKDSRILNFKKVLIKIT